MNVLFILPYCYIETKKVGWNTGFGIYTTQLAEYLAKKEDINIFVLSLRQRFKSDFIINNVLYIGLSDLRIASSLIKKKTLDSVVNIKKYNYYKQSELKKAVVALYVTGKANCIADIIKKYNIDFIHIHSLAQELYGVFMSDVIKPSNALVTIHSTYIDDPRFGSYNEYFATMANMLLEKEINMSFVSSGVRKQFVKRLHCSNDSARLMHVVLNGTCVNAGETISVQYKIDNKNKKILLCVGTICKRKNQTQLLEALKFLSLKERKNMLIYVIGRDATNGEFRELVNRYNLNDIVITVGFVSPEEIKQYYRIADGNLVLSKVEAFGLSMIEAFQYGVPTLCFKDISAAEDIFNECAVQFFDKRSDESVAVGILDFINKEWNRDAIRNWGKCFVLDKIAERYIELYHKIIC